MRKILAGIFISLLSALASGATTVPSSLINWVTAPSAPSQTAKFVFAAPTASAGVPTFRQLVAADVPTLAPLSSASPTGTWSFSARPTFNGNTPVDSGNVLTAVPGRLLNIQVFTSSGTYTPTSGATKAKVRVMSPGGGGGGNPATSTGQTAMSGPGNAGAYGEIWIPSGLTTQTVTIGAAGTAGTTAPTAGGTGGTTSFGALIVCTGGQGGPAGTASANTTSFVIFPTATAASCSGTGTFLVSGTGAPGEKGYLVAATSAAEIPGNGGSTMWGQGGQGRTLTPSAGTGYGAGAGAFYLNPSSAAAAGAAGAPGIVIVEEFN